MTTTPGATKISDVAKAAGVSPATVSRVMNDRASVDPELQERVREVAARLGYRPNAVARNLRKQATSVWALIISDIGNPFFTSVARGVEDVAQEAGYSVMLCNADEDGEKEGRYLSAAQQEQAAGIIISPHSGQTEVSSLAASRIPVVAIDRPSATDTDTVLVNSRAGARAATAHLLDEGWTRVGCVTGPEDAWTAVERAEGYREALAERGNGAPGVVAHVAFRIESGVEATARLLDSATPPDALFLGNAALALGALEELKRRGLRVGRDVGMVAFDDAPWAPFIDPPITVVSQPAYDIGQRAARLLLERITATAPEKSRHIVLESELVVRQSSRRAAAAS
jgi:LacI family transcriptional regulator